MSGKEDEGDKTALTSAFQIAKRFNAHVDALHIKIDPRTAAAFVGEGMTSAMIESVIDMAEKDGEKRRQMAQSLFDQICAENSVPVINSAAERPATGASAGFVQRQGNREDVLINIGRLYDLITICKDGPEEESANSLMINAALQDTGRPVLLMDDTIGDEFGKKIAVAWNGSVESSRALTFAMPFLKKAEKVTLISAIDDLDEDANTDGAVRYLEMHGINAKCCEIRGSSGKSTAESLLAQAQNCEADLLVMGAFTRSRLRRLFFGAVTEEILNNCPIPVLMAH
jgi:nucleotide-binding universal stress UspA family protein